MSWTEIAVAIKENRHELILNGAEISEKISKNGIDSTLFTVHGLNYLKISHTCLETLPDDIQNLQNLTTLVLDSNALKSLPKAIGKLSKLKILDCSMNKIENVPQELENLPQLSTLNLSSNLLDNLPCQKLNTKLSVLDLSHNKFEVFPDVCYSELVHLAEIKLHDNEIKEIPSNIFLLSSLKVFDIANNQITVVPGELADCAKLKDINLKNNKLSDKRLSKLVEQCRPKQVLDYVRQNCPKLGANATTNSNSKSKKGKKNRRASENEKINDAIDENCHKLRIMKVTDNVPQIKLLDDVKKVRPFILACIVRDLVFTEESFKKFIQLQTKLHEGICEKRNAATLATHDFDLLVPGDLTYTAKPPNDIKIRPLMRSKTFTAAELFNQLQSEAENLRKEKKRNVYSGVHKYLYLIEGKSHFPCLLDNSMQVISFPPITNSDITKMSVNTKTMLVEVTSASSQQMCKKVLDEFLRELVIQGLGSANNAPKSFHDLLVEQVKIVDIEGNMKSVYPSRQDAVYEDKNINVIRD